MGIIPVSVGQPIHLSLQLEDGEISLPKVVKAVVRDNLGVIVRNNLVLTHVGGGLFKNSTFNMPSLPFVTAQYTVYENDGLTISSDYSIELETFQQSSGSSGSDGIVFIGKEYIIGIESNGLLPDRLKIIRGDDQTFVLKIRTKDFNDPIDLTAITNISVEFIRSNRTSMILDLNPIPAIRAKAAIGEIVFTADNVGAAGNSIVLYFDGVSDLDTIIDDWNNANPLNPVSHNGLGSEILPEGSTRLAGGYNSYAPIQIIGNPVLGKIQVVLTEAHTKAIRLGLNQPFTVTLDYGGHPTGNRIIAQSKNAMDVVSPLE